MSLLIVPLVLVFYPRGLFFFQIYEKYCIVKNYKIMKLKILPRFSVKIYSWYILGNKSIFNETTLLILNAYMFL